MIFNLKNWNNNLSDSKVIVICLIVLNILSLLSIYSSLQRGGEFTEKHIFYRQLIWIIFSWIALGVFSRLNYRLYFGLSYPFYILNLLLLIGVSVFGETAMGAQRWLSVFGITFQPSELSKIAMIILLARIFSLARKNNFLKGFLLPLILCCLNALIIIKQPDLGTALILILLFIALGLCSKVNKLYFICLIGGGIILSPLAMNSLEDYQKKRLVVFINPNVDPLGSGYTIIQSKIAIGSGKVFGKGFLAGTQNQFNFLPERHTDFIFTVIAEEWGFIGSLLLLFLYWLIIKRILHAITRFRDNFAYFLGLGTVLLFFLHIFVNIGMTLGVLPVVGLPLIFLSYGGSNLLTVFILLGIFFNISRLEN